MTSSPGRSLAPGRIPAAADARAPIICIPPAALPSRSRPQPVSATRRHRGLDTGGWWPALALGCAAVAGLAITHSSLTQVVILVAVLPVAVACALLSPSRLILALPVWLVALGLVRRLLLGLGSHALLGDPLLLAEPAVLVLLLTVALSRGAAQRRGWLANAILVLTALALVEAVNPLQGGLTVGLGGVLLVMVPMLAFWIGRALAGDRTMTRLLLVVAALAVPAAIYGLVQTVSGFPSWDERWIQSVTASGAYVALSVGGTIRSFSSFSSSAEYATFLGIGLVVWLAYGRRPTTMPLMLAALGLLGAAVFLDSERTIVVLAVVAMGVMLAAMGGVRASRAAAAGLAALGILVVAVSLVTPRSGSSPGTSAGSLVSHQVSGLSQPFNPKDSTLAIHFQEMLAGLRSAVTDPVGHGTGSITRAASKFGSTSQGTEVDPSNAAVAFGVVGLAAYLVVAATGLSGAYLLARRRRDPLALAVLGLLLVTFLQWLNGGQYAVAWLPWLALGWVDRRLTGDEPVIL